MRKPSPALIVALLSLCVALGGAGMAATGGNFILGKSNTANATSYLSAPVGGGNAMNVSNLNTTAGSSALKLNVAAGHPPFLVNSTTKVSGLNADKLDGINSTGFVQGRGTALANRLGLVPTNGKTLFRIPGMGYLFAVCLPSNAYVTWINDTGSSIDGWADLNNSHFDANVVSGNNGFLDVANRASGVSGGTLALGIGSDSNPRRTALLHAFVIQGGLVQACRFQVQGTLWTSP